MSAPCPTFGFIVHPARDQDANAVRRELAERLAATGLVVDVRASHIVVTREGSQATDSDRQLVIELLNGEMKAGAATLSDLVDLNY